MAEEYKWCENEEAQYKLDEKSYCIFHAPLDAKDNGIAKKDYPSDKFNSIIFNKIDEAKQNKDTCNLSGTIFHADIDIFFNRILPKLDLSYATFSGRVGFQCSEFSGKADFTNTKFSDNADFFRSKFSGEADFVNITFSGKADFINTEFSGKAYFYGTKFSGEAYFGNTKFSDEVGFFYLNLKEGNVRFDGVNLKKASFINTDVTQIDFINCTWYPGKGRDILYDEYKVITNKWSIAEVRKVEILYRMLKKKSKDDHNEQNVSNWHYGEKEMQKLTAWMDRDYISWLVLSIYKLSNGYGERYLRSLGFLLILYVVATILIACAGLGPVTAALSDNTTYTICSLHDIKDTLSLKYFAASLTFFTFQKEYDFKPATHFGSFIKLLFQILIPIQAAFCVMALRNKFRR